MNGTPYAVAPAKVVRRREGALSEAAARRLGAGLNALGQALQVLHVLQLTKADGSRPAEAIELLDHADDLISGRLQP